MKKRPQFGRGLSFVALALLLAGGGCRSGGGDEAQSPAADGSEPSADVPEVCREAVRAYRDRGETGAPKLVRGAVRLPDFRQKAAESGDAGAKGASFREKPAREAEILVYRGTDGVEPPENGLAAAETDADGQWCVAVSTDVELGPTLLAAARIDDGDKGGDATVLRRSLVTGFGNAITVRSEAMTRVLTDRRALEGLEAGAYLNLLSVAATAVDLLSPVDWTGRETVAEAVEKVKAAMKGDERVAAKLEEHVTSAGDAKK